MTLIDPWRDQGARFIWQPHHILWIMAAETLPKTQRLLAYRDIGLMTGASWDQVLSKAGRVRVSSPPDASPPILRTKGLDLTAV